MVILNLYNCAQHSSCVRFVFVNGTINLSSRIKIFKSRLGSHEYLNGEVVDVVISHDEDQCFGPDYKNGYSGSGATEE